MSLAYVSEVYTLLPVEIIVEKRSTELMSHCKGTALPESLRTSAIKG